MGLVNFLCTSCVDTPRRVNRCGQLEAKRRKDSYTKRLLLLNATDNNGLFMPERSSMGSEL